MHLRNWSAFWNDKAPLMHEQGDWIPCWKNPQCSACWSGCRYERNGCVATSGKALLTPQPAFSACPYRYIRDLFRFWNCCSNNSICLLSLEFNHPACVAEFLECRAQNKKNCKTCYCVTGVPLVELGSPNSEAVSSPSGVPFNEWQTRARDYKSSELDEVALVGSWAYMPPRAHPQQSESPPSVYYIGTLKYLGISAFLYNLL